MHGQKMAKNFLFSWEDNPEFQLEELCDKEEITRGSFGAVFIAKRSQILVDVYS